jgi:hypothetical protein
MAATAALGVGQFLKGGGDHVEAQAPPSAPAEASPPPANVPTPADTQLSTELQGGRESLQPAAANTASSIISDLATINAKYPGATEVIKVESGDYPQFIMGNAETAPAGVPKIFASFTPGENRLEVRSELPASGNDGDASNTTSIDLEFTTGPDNPITAAASANSISPDEFQNALTSPDVSLISSTVTDATGNGQRLLFEEDRIEEAIAPDWDNTYAVDNYTQSVDTMTQALTANLATLHAAAQTS